MGARGSRLLEAAGDALRNLAFVEHRLDALLPELRLHDARLRLRYSAMRATDHQRAQGSADCTASGIVVRRLSHTASSVPRLASWELAPTPGSRGSVSAVDGAEGCTGSEARTPSLGAHRGEGAGAGTGAAIVKGASGLKIPRDAD